MSLFSSVSTSKVFQRNKWENISFYFTPSCLTPTLLYWSPSALQDLDSGTGICTIQSFCLASLARQRFSSLIFNFFCCFLTHHFCITVFHKYSLKYFSQTTPSPLSLLLLEWLDTTCAIPAHCENRDWCSAPLI